MAAYQGGGLREGIEAFATQLFPRAGGSVGQIAEDILEVIMIFVGILAVVAIVIAGLILLVQGYDDGRRQQAFRAIINVIAGLIVVFVATALVRTFIGFIE